MTWYLVFLVFRPDPGFTTDWPSVYASTFYKSEKECRAAIKGHGIKWVIAHIDGEIVATCVELPKKKASR